MCQFDFVVFYKGSELARHYLMSETVFNNVVHACQGELLPSGKSFRTTDESLDEVLHKFINRGHYVFALIQKKGIFMKALDKQIGGNHYQKYAVSPIIWAVNCHINALEFSVLKYLLRYQDKNGIEDLNKAQHCCDMLSEQSFIPNNIDATARVNDFCMQNKLSCYQHAALSALFDHDYIELEKVITKMQEQETYERGQG